MTGVPSICDDFGTMDLEERVATYHPGWYVTWNQVDDDKMEALYAVVPDGACGGVSGYGRSGQQPPYSVPAGSGDVSGAPPATDAKADPEGVDDEDGPAAERGAAAALI